MRSSQADAAARTFGILARGTIESVNDKGTRQELDLNLLRDETKTGVEVFYHYGFKSVPVAPSTEGGIKKYAAAIIAFLSGNRSHGVVIATGDRRFEPKDWGGGQVGHYHYKGGTGKFTDKAYAFDAGPEKLPHVTKVGATTVQKEDGKITTDVEKKIFTQVVHIGAGGTLAA